MFALPSIIRPRRVAHMSRFVIHQTFERYSRRLTWDCWRVMRGTKHHDHNFFIPGIKPSRDRERCRADLISTGPRNSPPEHCHCMRLYTTLKDSFLKRVQNTVGRCPRVPKNAGVWEFRAGSNLAESRRSSNVGSRYGEFAEIPSGPSRG